MDGDKMGKLVSGENIASTWKSIMHPDIVKRMQKPSFEDIYRKNWSKIYNGIDNDLQNRLVTPAIHASISEALGDFALYGVKTIIKENDGKLIYAGGDDVCAILPIDNVLKAAKKIQIYYNSSFNLISANNNKLNLKEWKGETGKLSLGLGNGIKNDKKLISISAGILICHHKESLKEMIHRAHTLLDSKAKEETGRNACALELKKRSGGSRYFSRKWDDDSWNALEKIKENLEQINDEKVSRSLIYRLEKFKPGIEAILKQEDYSKNKLLSKFLEKQLEKSKVPKEKRKELSELIETIIVKKSDKKKIFNPEGLIIIAFLAGKGEVDV